MIIDIKLSIIIHTCHAHTVTVMSWHRHNYIQCIYKVCEYTHLLHNQKYRIKKDKNIKIKHSIHTKNIKLVIWTLLVSHSAVFSLSHSTLHHSLAS